MVHFKAGEAINPEDSRRVHLKVMENLAVQTVLQGPGHPGCDDDVAGPEIDGPAPADVCLEDVTRFGAGFSQIMVAGNDDALVRGKSRQPDGTFGDLPDALGELVRIEWRKTGIKAGKLPELDDGAAEHKATAGVFADVSGILFRFDTAADIIPHRLVFEGERVVGVS